jgi:phosphatidylserine/phosphatidylglycerophosphate/cardiolipin synthase-like enzyme
VPERDFTHPEVALPPRAEIPGVDLQVVNFHQPVLGTFHAKFMVVDRRMALVQSNNIQDNANLEMAVQVEGPVVDSLYDMALISWSIGLGNGLPMIDSPAAEAGDAAYPSWTDSFRRLFDEEGRLRGHEVVMDPERMEWTDAYGGGHVPEDAPVINGLEEAPKPLEPTTDRDSGIAPSPSPSLSPPPDLPELTHETPLYDDDLAGEIFRVQTSTTPRPGEDPLAPVTRKLNHTKNPTYSVPDAKRPPPSPASHHMTPYIAHPIHDPVPMALVNRPPYGPVTHRSVRNPQNECWLSALRNARKNVFIQSPTLNAEPLLPAIVDACERGVDVHCYICIGYNDAVSHLTVYILCFY